MHSRSAILYFSSRDTYFVAEILSDIVEEKARLKMNRVGCRMRECRKLKGRDGTQSSGKWDFRDVSVMQRFHSPSTLSQVPSRQKSIDRVASVMQNASSAEKARMNSCRAFGRRYPDGQICHSDTDTNSVSRVGNHSRASSSKRFKTISASNETVSRRKNMVFSFSRSNAQSPTCSCARRLNRIRDLRGTDSCAGICLCRAKSHQNLKRRSMTVSWWCLFKRSKTKCFVHRLRVKNSTTGVGTKRSADWGDRIFAQRHSVDMEDMEHRTIREKTPIVYSIAFPSKTVYRDTERIN